ncbi:MAG: PAS domain S-box protein [Bryobacteraceae bacterium]
MSDLQHIADTIPGMIWAAGPDKLRYYFNQHWLHFTGCKLEQLTGNGWLECVHPDDRQCCQDTYLSACEARHPFTVEYRLHRHNGGYHWVLDKGVPQLDQKGEILGFAGLCIDIHARKQTERKLRESDDRYRMLLENLKDYAVFTTDREGRIITWNAGAERIVGYPESEIIGQPLEIIFTPEDRANNIPNKEVRRAIAAGSAEDERWHVRKDGRRYFAFGMLSVLRDEDGNLHGFSKVMRDMTDRKRLEEQLQQTRKMESLGVLAGGVAHDFNNLLMGILGNIGLVQEALADGDPNRRFLDEAIRASERAAHLTQQMLAYAGKGRFVTKLVDLSETVREMAGLIHTSVPKNVELRLQLAPDLPLIEVDTAQIQQVVMNLAVNGAEAIREEDSGVVAITTAAQTLNEEDLRDNLLFEELKPGNYVLLEVRDTGVGMSEEERTKIFDPFFTTKFIGRGLGLPAVHGIVRGHKGAIQVSSEPGQGSVFKVLFPVAAAKPAGPQKPDEEDLRGKGRILVIEDEESVRRVVRFALERYGYEVLLAGDGRAGVEVFQENASQIELVLLDMTMPGMSGEETFGVLKKIRADIPIMVTSGYDEAETIRRFAGRGVTEFIHKPYTGAQLARKVKSVLFKK